MTPGNRSRRDLLAAVAAFPAISRAQARKQLPAPPRKQSPGERVRFLDPGTEAELFRVTDPKNGASRLAPPHHVTFSRRSNFLLFASDRGGSWQAWALDMKSWIPRVLTTSAKPVDPRSLTLTVDERGVLYSDGEAVWMQLTGGRPRQLHKFADKPGPGIGVAPEGAALVGDGNKLVSVNFLRAAATTVAETEGPVEDPMHRPKRASAAYRSGGALWLAHLDGQRNAKLKTAPGGVVMQSAWAPDGRTILYLFKPDVMGQAHSIREIDPDSGEDTLIAKTSQFGSFGWNSDATAFVGASVSKAGPFLLLLVRKVKRELVLCEHASSSPLTAWPVFSPDSQLVFFESDRHGKPSLYMMEVRKLVEKT